jgi:hypothetical protein
MVSFNLGSLLLNTWRISFALNVWGYKQSSSQKPQHKKSSNLPRLPVVVQIQVSYQIMPPINKPFLHLHGYIGIIDQYDSGEQCGPWASCSIL